MATKLLKTEPPAIESPPIPPLPGGGSWRLDSSNKWQRNEEPAIEPVIEPIAEPAEPDSDSIATS